MSATPETIPARRQRPKDRKQQILVVARDLFVELGFHNVTMNVIAERVGITAGALYRHFANKAVLLEAVVHDSFTDLDSLVDRDTDLAGLLAQAAPLAVGRPYLGPLWSRESRHLSDETFDDVRRLLRDTTRGWWVPLLRRERPELSGADAELLAWGIQSVLVSVGHYVGRVPAAQLTQLAVAAANALSQVHLVQGPHAPDAEGPPLKAHSLRERLLVAASRLFCDQGYQETSLAEIGAAADVTGPNLYVYFESKAAILRAVVERGNHALWLDLDVALGAHSVPRGVLGAVVEAYVNRVRGWAGLGGSLLSGEAEVEAVVRSYEREYVGEWVALLQQSRPELDQMEARVLVHIALTVIQNLSRTPHLAIEGSFCANVTAIVLAVLDSSPPDEHVLMAGRATGV